MKGVSLEQRRTDYLKATVKTITEVERIQDRAIPQAMRDQIRAQVHMQFFYGGKYVAYSDRYVGRKRDARCVRTIYAVNDDYSELHRECWEDSSPGVSEDEVVTVSYVTDPYGPIAL